VVLVSESYGGLMTIFYCLMILGAFRFLYDFTGLSVCEIVAGPHHHSHSWLQVLLRLSTNFFFVLDMYVSKKSSLFFDEGRGQSFYGGATFVAPEF
jgi:hypothetical protein